MQSLRDLAIGTPKGSVPLAQLATFHYGLEESTIWRRDRLPTITVQADVAKGVKANTVIGQLAGSIEEIRKQLPPGYRLEIGGARERRARKARARSSRSCR